MNKQLLIQYLPAIFQLIVTLISYAKKDKAKLIKTLYLGITIGLCYTNNTNIASFFLVCIYLILFMMSGFKGVVYSIMGR